MSNNIFWSPQKLLSYNAFLNFVIGERGVGKSYAMKSYEITHFLKTHKQFVYLRRYKEELEKAIKNQNSGTYFNQVKNDEKFKDVELDNQNEIMYINKEIARFCPSTFNF